MKKTGKRPRPSLMLLWLTCAVVCSSCATTSPPAALTSCPAPLPAPSNVMRTPNYEARLRALLFKSSETPTTSSAPAKPW
ncbi:hypothetical protein XcvCFBP7113P_16745 [Xanthomonas citri pv. vignicola]|nr:hypothetical protein XcvCFBP7113P_16745 [Xanthomonas citri pv. vignicola]